MVVSYISAVNGIYGTLFFSLGIGNLSVFDFFYRPVSVFGIFLPALKFGIGISFFFTDRYRYWLIYRIPSMRTHARTHASLVSWMVFLSHRDNF